MSVRIKDVAKVAGVSVATVSRALAGGPVSESLRQRVEQAVRATGYRPDLSARRLRTRRSETIGLIVSDILNPFFTAVARGVEDAAYAAGMRVILCNTDENPDRESMYLRLMQEERVTGLILAPTLGMGRLTFDFPVVLIDRADPASGHDSVVIDNHRACTELVTHCHDQGYRRIGGLFGNTSATGRQRAEAYRVCMDSLGLTPDVRFVAPTATMAESVVTDWLTGPNPPDAIVNSNGRLLMGSARAIRRLGVSMPDDLGLLGFDNDEWTELVDPGVTVYEQPVREIGRTAMALISERLKDSGTTTRQVVLSGRCLIRGSTSRRSAGQTAALLRGPGAP
ncbi:MAG: LacI family transcriptional regulator [Rhodospirillum sp.]|nr:LacI family transcriptional regulator [Rhodospirillum sp.]MCF8491965.1 LacI family transcriptional regulator [Rhodospirillum sp.]MCF8501044.1 LacI family transcriptional regulator [Rhodospirillum sp.]